MKRHLLAVLAMAAAAGCADDGAAPTASDPSLSLLPCVFGQGRQLRVGESITLQGGDASTVCVGADAAGAEFTLVPFLADPNGDTRQTVSAVGGNLRPVTGPPTPALVPAPFGPARPVPDERLHLRMMKGFRRDFAPRLHPAAGGARSLAPARTAASAAPQGPAPAVGDFITVNIPQFYRAVDACVSSATQRARVGAVTQKAILVNDPSNPPGGLTDAELQAFGDQFDRLIYPTDLRYFGEPTDLDGNGGRVIIVFTREVNALTPAGSGGYFGGFFWPGDLFPRVGNARLDACPRSNVGEIFYVLAPDPQGVVNRNPRSKELILQSAAGTIGHELQHLINASRRIFVNNADQLEDVWLDEGLSHSAEELLFYEDSGLAPKQNIDLAKLGSSPRIATAADRFMIENFGRYLLYLEAPDSNSLLGPDELETRGAAWAFLRYAADRKTGPDQPFFFSLVNTTSAGVDNVSRVIGADALDWMQDWTLSVYTDDAVSGLDPRFTQPSWNYRSIMPDVAEYYEGTPASTYPLRVHVLTSGTPVEYDLRGGGATYLRFGVAPSGKVGLRLASGDAPAPASLRFSLVRTR
ncbi:MAG: hypothetical protein JO040_08005 [Gemmatimonadetes bacterium]|nr:hypothetical protein [Gemmatimonadota bacterium]